jgi:SpoVK/Ycf46/Vps4 family AAA+-type ATPase
LTALFPAFQDDDLFEQRFKALFGTSKISITTPIYNSLKAYTNEQKELTSLHELINTHLRPRLVKHLTDNHESYIGFFESIETLAEEIRAIQSGFPIHNIQATSHSLASWLACTIRVYNNPDQINFIDYTPNENATDIIALVQAGSQFNPLIDVEKLSPELNTQLTPYLLIAQEPSTSDEARRTLISTLHNEHFNRLLRTTFSSNPNHLSGMHALYTLCLVPNDATFNNITLEKNTIYLRVINDQFEYCLKAPFEIIKGTLTKRDLNCTITESFSTEDLSRVQTMIFNVLTKAGRIPQSVPTRPAEFIDPFKTPYVTQTEGRVLRLNALPEIQNIHQLISSDRIKLLPSQPIGSGVDWTISMAQSAAVGALISTARFDISALVTMISMGSIELGPLALASFPFFISCLATSFGISIMGKHHAIEFEEAIRNAKSHIDTGNYSEAMKCLDYEFSRWFGARASRHSFLTKEHYALAHFLRGTGALYNNEEKDIKKAYDEYEAAARDAKSAKHWPLLMVTQLQRIALLKMDIPTLLPNSNIIDQIITELTEYLPDAFADLYWKYNDKVAQISKRLLNPNPWNESEITSINQYIIADGTFMLKHFATGRGQFMDVFFSFFQSTVLAAIHQTKWEHLNEPTRNQLKIQLKTPVSGNSDELKAPALYFTLQKLRQSAQKLHAFMRDQPVLATQHDIVMCITNIKNFAKGLINHTQKANIFTDITHDLNDILLLLNISEQEINQYLSYVNASVLFLTDLAADFNQKQYQTVGDLLEDLIVPNSSILNSISSKTGDTMLHRLAMLPPATELKSQIQKATNRLKASALVRNHRNETPVYLLTSHKDPHGLLAIIDADPMITLGNQLNTVDTFLEKIKANPKVEGHFLLLDGPAGTGKTSTVQRHLAQKGYSVQTWSRGEENDSKVSGLPVRISKFFSDAKKEAAKSQKTQILFIDEIDRVTPLSTGGASNPIYHNRDDDTATFQTEITALKGHRVVVIGATNFPMQLAKAMLSRAATNRIHFSLPNEEQRNKLLNFFFRTKAIDIKHIEQLAKTAVAYSPRELQDFVDKIKEQTVTQKMMINYFNEYARTLTTSFKGDFPYADLFMPSFKTLGDLAELFSANEELAEQMNRLKSKVTIEGNKHTLLYGPPGSGKTTAVRMFAQNSGRVLIAIQADESISKEELKKIFDRAKQLAPCIIFFDELHNLAHHRTRHGTFIQTEMDGITRNDITIIAATNYPERIEPAILSRFTSKIELPKLSAAALGNPIKASLIAKIKQYETPVYVDLALNNELNHSPDSLCQECDGLSLRHISAAFGYLMEDLKRENIHNGITYLRLQDVCFAVLRMKIQEGLVNRPLNNITNTSYIQQNKNSFFPSEKPTGGIQPLQEISYKIIIPMN